MTQYQGQYPPPPAMPPAPPGRPPSPPTYGGGPNFPGGPGWFGPPQVVHVVSKPGGFWRGVMIALALLLFGITFVLGITFGIFAMIAGSDYEETVVRHTYRDGGSNTIAILPVLGDIDDR